MERALTPYIQSGNQSRQNNDVLMARNKLFNKGKEIQGRLSLHLQKFRFQQTKENHFNLMQSLAEMSTYVSIREAVAPNIAIDNALAQQKGMINNIKKALQEIEV
jgi:hypothetical protein